VFCSLAYRDVLMIGRGLLILVVVIALGLSVAEQQLSTLTQRQEFVRILAMNRNDEGVYTLEVLGTSCSISAVYEVAEISNQDNSVSILTPLATWIIPKYLYIDCRKELAWLALHIKYLEQHIRQGWEIINVYLRQFR
jgi:coenzyme F420-reducing hydrogenase beta subunit